MYETISTKNMTHEDWLYLRKSGIGGSDAGAVCGLNPYASPMSVYHDKISDELNLADSESMRQGRDLEEYVARRFMEASGKEYAVPIRCTGAKNIHLCWQILTVW